MFGKGLNLDQAPPLSLPLIFFLTAPLFGMAAGLLLLWRGADLLLTPLAIETVALVHLITLGVVTMVNLGALYQIVPVLVGSVVPRPGLGRLVHLGLTLGLLALIGGMLFAVKPLFWLALLLLAIAFLLFDIQITQALRQASTFNPTTASLRIATGSLALAVLLGLLFMFEYSFGWLPLDRAAFTATHVYLALGGWVAPLITGVAYAIIPMFYLGVEFPARRGWIVLASQVCTVLTGTAVAHLAPAPVWHLVPAAFAALGISVFSVTTWRALQQRKRRITDTTLRFWQLALLAVPLSLIALAGYALHPNPRWLMVFAVLFLLGFATAAINGMLYKIVAFLIWLHRFSKLAGKVNIPLLKDIIPPGPTMWQWWGFVVMMLLLISAVATGSDLLVRLAGLATVGSFGGLLVILTTAARFRPDPKQMEPIIKIDHGKKASMTGDGGR